MIHWVLEQLSITHLKKMPHRSQYMFLFLHNMQVEACDFCFVPSSTVSRFLRSRINLLTESGKTINIILHTLHENAHNFTFLIHTIASNSPGSWKKFYWPEDTDQSFVQLCQHFRSSQIHLSFTVFLPSLSRYPLQYSGLYLEVNCQNTMLQE